MMPSRFAVNPFFEHEPAFPATMPADGALTFHKSLPFYQPTPLFRQPALAKSLGLKNLFVKDESQRFGLNAFKAIGASYAIYRFLDQQSQREHGKPLDGHHFFSRNADKPSGAYTFATATDGNHGRAVAWVARQLGHKAVIYAPENMAATRKKAIEAEGAKVVVVRGHYDAAVERMAQDAGQNGWHIISDTAWPGYEQIPLWIMTGYQTIFYEADMALAEDEKPDVVLVQAGVGGLAAAAAAYYAQKYGSSGPRLVCVEPLDADCLLESIVSGNGEMANATGTQNSIMSGLNCGTPSSLAWPFVKTRFYSFLAIDDGWAAQAMRALYHPVSGDQRVVAGESGAAGLAGLFALREEAALHTAWEQTGLSESATVMVINTEGDTEPDNFRKIVRENGAAFF